MTGVKPDSSAAGPLRRRYAQLRRKLGQVGYLSQGSVQDRTGRGRGYQWTRKLARKTITVSLTAEQFAALKQAVGNYRKLRRQLRELEQLSRRIIFQTTPHPDRRKRLSRKVLGTN